jgi:hypothetical protein
MRDLNSYVGVAPPAAATGCSCANANSCPLLDSTTAKFAASMLKGFILQEDLSALLLMLHCAGLLGLQSAAAVCSSSACSTHFSCNSRCLMVGTSAEVAFRNLYVLLVFDVPARTAIHRCRENGLVHCRVQVTALVFIAATQRGNTRAPHQAV